MTRSYHHEDWLQKLEHYLNPAHLLIRPVLYQSRARRNGKIIKYFAWALLIGAYEPMYKLERIVLKVLDQCFQLITTKAKEIF
jgi:hypothetical protein